MACSVEEIHIDNIGTIFEVTLKDCDEIVDISIATIKQIEIWILQTKIVLFSFNTCFSSLSKFRGIW